MMQARFVLKRSVIVPLGLWLLLGVTAPAWANDAAAGVPGERVNPRWQERVEGLPVPATVLVQVGDTPPGGGGAMVDVLNAPFTDGGGRPGFSGSLTSGERFIWIDAAIAFLDSSVVGSTLTGAESTMGISDADGFIYSPSVDGDDAVWSHNGLVLREGVAAPGFPGGTTVTFNSRPTMLPSGAAYWVAGFDDTGGGSTQGRMVYTTPTASSGDVSVVLRSDDMVSGLAIDRPSGIGFDYQISDNGLHHIHELLMDTGSTVDDGAIYVDGALVARETLATGSGTNWDNFDVVSINDSGNYIFSGDDDGATTVDELIAYNGVIGLREGDTVDGITLISSAAVLGASLNNAGWAVHIWNRSSGQEFLFVACDASDLASSVLIAATDDDLDLDGNGSGDATLTDFEASTVIGPGLWLAEDSRVFVGVDLDFGAGDVEAIISFELPCLPPEIFTDGFESGNTSGWSSTTP